MRLHTLATPMAIGLGAGAIVAIITGEGMACPAVFIGLWGVGAFESWIEKYEAELQERDAKERGEE